MGLLAIDDIKEGMILEEDLAEEGQTLIKGGVSLTGRHLKLCRSWGIQHLPIKNLDADQMELDFFASLDPEIMTKANTLALEKCVHLDPTIPLHQELYQLHLRRLVRHLVP